MNNGDVSWYNAMSAGGAWSAIIAPLGDAGWSPAETSFLTTTFYGTRF